jgi:hypothetical protein
MQGLNPANISAIFQKCAPAIKSNIQQCGTVTACSAIPLQSGDLTTVYMSGSDYRIMEGLLMHDMEIRMCAQTQYGLYDFLMSNRVNLSKKINSVRLNSGLIEVAPFIMGRQYDPINNEYWIVGNGRASGSNWVVEVSSSANIPFDLRNWPVGEYVYILSQSSGGTKSTTAWTVVSAVDNGDNTGDITLAAANSGSHLNSAQLSNPVNGIAMIGTNNVNDYENFCNEQAAYMNWRNVPFWVQTTRNSLCKSSNYDKWRALLLEDNPLYREFGDLDDVQRNKQLGLDFQKRFVRSIFYQKKLNSNQTLANYNSLPQIESYQDASLLGLGTDGDTCQGFRANAEGIYEQMAACNRIADLQGGTLNIPNLARTLYAMMRVRESNNSNSARTFDIFTDSVTAETFNQSMIQYYASKSADQNGNTTLRLTMSVDNQVKTANFGFNYRSYKLFWPNITINIVTHDFFDDMLTAMGQVSQSNVGRVLWILDFSGIYPGILATNKVIAKTGDLKTLAAVDANFACVMKVPTREQTMTSITYTVVVECPAGSVIIENFNNQIFSLTDDGVSVYPSQATSTTTTTYH